MNQEKKCRKCGIEKLVTNFPRMNIGKYGRGSTCFGCMKLRQKPAKQLVRTPINKIGAKRSKRIKEKGSEGKVFIEIWKERVTPEGKRICDNCGGNIKIFHSSCFAHKYNKRDNPKLRYEKSNIALVHSIWETMDSTGKTYQCHKEFDLKFNKVKSKL